MCIAGGSRFIGCRAGCKERLFGFAALLSRDILGSFKDSVFQILPFQAPGALLSDFYASTSIKFHFTLAILYSLFVSSNCVFIIHISQEDKVTRRWVWAHTYVGPQVMGSYRPLRLWRGGDISGDHCDTRYTREQHGMYLWSSLQGVAEISVTLWCLELPRHLRHLK